MAEHRFYQQVSRQSEQCDCELCLRHDDAMAATEAAIASPVGQLLDAGWTPLEIVALVKTGSPSSSRASMLVRIDVLRRASAWFGDDTRTRHLAESFQLAKRTGLRPGQPRPGWFEDWLWGRGGGDIAQAQRAIRHEVTAIMPVLALIGQIEGDPTLWRAALPSTQVIGSRRYRFPYQRLVPEANDWAWAN